MKNNIRIDAYILAGGKSSRMGTDKGLMSFGGSPMIEHVIDQLRPVVNEIFIVSNNHDYDIFNLEVIQDEIKNIGPAGGIHSALKHCATDKIFIIGCDMPLITSASIEFIINNNNSSLITLPELDGNIEPLFGLYSKDCLEKWEELIQKNIIKLHDLVTHFRLNKLNVDGNALFNKSIFSNINTKVEFDFLTQGHEGTKTQREE